MRRSRALYLDARRSALRGWALAWVLALCPLGVWGIAVVAILSVRNVLIGAAALCALRVERRMLVVLATEFTNAINRHLNP